MVGSLGRGPVTARHLVEVIGVGWKARGRVALGEVAGRLDGEGLGDQVGFGAGLGRSGRADRLQQLGIGGAQPLLGHGGVLLDQAGLVRIAADHQADAELFALAVGFARAAQHHDAIDHRSGRPGLQDVGDGYGAELGGRGVSEAQALGPAGPEGLAGERRPADRGGRGRTAAGFGDGAHEEALGGLGCGQHLHRHGAGAFTEDGDIPGVAAEGRDVLLHPLQGGDLVHQAVVAEPAPVGVLGGQSRVGEVAEATQAVVDRHHHDATPGQRRPIVEWHAARTADERAAVDEHHHRFAGFWRLGGREDIEEQAILALRPHLSPGIVAEMRLRAGRAVGEHRAHAGPGLHGLGRAPAKGAGRSRRVGDAPKDGDIAVRCALDHTGVEFGERRRMGAASQRKCDRDGGETQHFQGGHPDNPPTAVSAGIAR